MQQDWFEIITVRTVDATTRFVNNVNTVSCRVWNTQRIMEGKPPFEIYNEVKTAYGDKAINRSRVVESLKMVVCLCMMIRGTEDLQL